MELRTSGELPVRLILATTAVLLLTSANTSVAQDGSVRLAFEGGRVYLAAEATAADVLREWARVGVTEVTGAELLAGEKLFLTLKDVDELEALKLLVGEKFAFMGSFKLAVEPGTSRYARLVIDTVDAVDSLAKQPVVVPESSYVYLTPEKTLAIDYSPSITPAFPTDDKMPEEAYSYYVPEKTGAINATTVDYVKVDSTLPPPEVRFAYYAGDVYAMPVSRLTWYPIYRLPLADPEVRYTYFIPPKAMP